MVDAIGSPGRRHWAGRLARKRAEKWAQQVLLARSQERTRGTSSPLDGLLDLRDPGFKPLSPHTMGVELLNVTRPITAVAWYVTFCALALHSNPGLATELAQRPELIVPFCHEVRRFYPFAPFMAGRAVQSIELGDVVAHPGDMVAVDVYGMHHNPDFWSEPQFFNPERFSGARPAAYAPQGAGDLLASHRCPGEDLTLQLMAAATTALVERDWSVPLQPLSVDLSRIPARLPTGLRIQSH
jgi:fatty-acid peroxygenase